MRVGTRGWHSTTAPRRTQRRRQRPHGTTARAQAAVSGRRCALPVDRRAPARQHRRRRCTGARRACADRRKRADHDAGRGQVVQGERSRRNPGHHAARRRRPRVAAAGSDRLRPCAGALDAHAAGHPVGTPARMGHRGTGTHGRRRGLHQRAASCSRSASPSPAAQGARLHWLERTRIDGGDRLLQSPIGLAGAPVFGCLWAWGPMWNEALLETVRERLGDAAAPVTVLASQLLLARTRGATTAQVRAVLEQAWRTCGRSF